MPGFDANRICLPTRARVPRPFGWRPPSGRHVSHPPLCLLPRIHALLPAELAMPRHLHRIEDGAGFQSTACWTLPCVDDVFGRCVACGARASFRAVFTCVSWQLLRLAPRIRLSPSISWILSCRICAVFSLCLRAPPLQTFCLWHLGNPFALDYSLLFALATASADPDAAFICELVDGVSLGFSSPISACPCMFPPACEQDPPIL